MRLLLAFAAAQSLGLFQASCEAFSIGGSWTTATRSALPQSPSLTQRHVGSWDNDDFLDNLGANKGGELPSDDIEGAELTEEMREKLKQDNEEEEKYGGGSKFKELLEKAKSREAAGEPMPKSLKNPFADNPYAGIEGLDPEATPKEPASPALDPNALTVEQQAEMFRAMMQGVGGAPAAPGTGAVHNQPVKPPKPDRKAGRNRDADAIQNTADVYFAQLKRDSTVRSVARLRGEEEKANAIFEDEKIEELKGLINENPHLAGKREEEKKVIETAAEEMLAYQQAMAPKQGNKRSAGISYKQALAERKKKLQGGGTSSSSAPAVAASSAPPKPVEPTPEPPKAEIPQPPAVVEEPKVEIPPATPTPPEPTMQQQTQVQPVQPQTEAKPQPPQQPPQQSTSNDWGSPEDIRRGIRTLMGLILKHRGGPGFGAGGLKGQDIGQYENLANEITALLREEAVSYKGQEEPPPMMSTPSTPVETPSVHPQTQESMGGLATVPSSPSGQAQVESMLACIEGAIIMYKNSPPELKEGVLMTVRAALLSAVNTMSKVLGQNEEFPQTSGAGGSVESMLGCVEGAIMMYRNSPPELQQGVMLTLRAALLSAVNTCNKIIAENEKENFEQYQQATAGKNMPPPTQKPAQFYDVVQVKDIEEAVTGTISSSSGQDENTMALEDLYNKLQSAAGDGKMGLREDLTPQEASDVADGIAEMRAILLEELDNGIPQSGTSVMGSAAPSGDPTTSTYQQMLAEARSEKSAKA